MRFLIIALMLPSLALADADQDLQTQYKKVISMYPEAKPQFERAHSAWLIQAKADCDFFAVLKKNNLSRTHTKDCMEEAALNRANQYELITINSKN